MDAIKLSGVALILAVISPANAQPLSQSEASSLSPRLRSLGRIWIRAETVTTTDDTGDTGSGASTTDLFASLPGAHCRRLGHPYSSYTTCIPPNRRLQIPIIVLPITLVGVVVYYWKEIMGFFGLRFRSSAQRTATPARPRTSQVNGNRVITAEQLANAPSTANLVASGTTPATAPSGSGEARPTQQRRRRRPRRTPSQMSTRSLPPYMAQAGEQELVLARAIPDEEEEDGSSSEGESGEGHPNHGDVATPLLPEGGPGRSQPPVASEPAVRPSMDSHMSSHDTHVTNRSSLRLIDVRGEAPAYFEVVDQSNQDDETNDIEQGRVEPAARSGL
ncbi:hypothetical protein FRB90_004094, partial [Tulasnella sp. 427]